MRYAALLLLLACREPFVPADAAPMAPPTNAAQLWTEVESCAGRTGDWHRIAWFLVSDYPFVGPHGEPLAGFWEAPHTIYLSVGEVNRPITIKHEMLHDLLQTGSHPPLFAACGLLN